MATDECIVYECDGMNGFTRKYQNKQKEWHDATHPFKRTTRNDGRTHKPTLANSQTVPAGGFSRREILLFATPASKPLDQAEDGAGHRYCTRHERAVFAKPNYL